MKKENLKFYERLLVLLVTFVIVMVVTGGIVGQYVKTKNQDKPEQKASYRVVLETVRFIK